MTNNQEKRVDGWLIRNFDGDCRCDMMADSPWHRADVKGIEVRIERADSPTAADARAEVIAEVRTTITELKQLKYGDTEGSRALVNMVFAALDAKIADLEARGRG